MGFWNSMSIVLGSLCWLSIVIGITVKNADLPETPKCESKYRQVAVVTRPSNYMGTGPYIKIVEQLPDCSIQTEYWEPYLMEDGRPDIRLKRVER